MIYALSKEQKGGGDKQNARGREELIRDSGKPEKRQL